MIVTASRSASQRAIALFPAAVGPQMTRMSATSKAAVELIPRQLDDGCAAMHVVRGQRGVAQRDEQRAHLARRELVPGFDRCLARDGGSETLVPRRRAGMTI